MELLYIWIEDYKNIKEQGFNFSPRYRFEFKNGVLSCVENTDAISTGKDFFGSGITNVTAIIGENGAGKSTVLELILHCKYNIANEISKLNGKIKYLKEEKENEDIIENQKESTYLSNVDVIFYSNQVTTKYPYKDNINSCNISTDYLLVAESRPFHDFQADEMWKQIDFISNFPTINFLLENKILPQYPSPLLVSHKQLCEFW
ncbi:AAA family ATPase [Hugenholtzia roseola]|uniref:AAA family ATPase n=1 Tax=Hugenholtzia roseola TaxID=1002 RepID=UPI0004123239|nr:AAA family ATPase [Hugenholtzia roseola]